MIFASMTIGTNGEILGVTHSTGDCLSYIGNTVAIDYYANEHLFGGENHKNFYYDKDTFSIRPKPYQVVPIAILQADAAAIIDSLAGMTRLKYITVAPGQEMTYIAKLADAKAYIAAGYPVDATPYPWIALEATATGATNQQVADLIIYTAGLWSTVGATIEGKRQAVKQAITAALTVTDIHTAEQGFIDAMAAL